MYEWSNGDLITAERLNSSQPMYVRKDTVGHKQVLDKTWQEIYDAVADGVLVYTTSYHEEEYGYAWQLVTLEYIVHDTERPIYYAQFLDGVQYECDSANDYPEYPHGGGPK